MGLQIPAQMLPDYKSGRAGELPCDNDVTASTPGAPGGGGAAG